MITERVAYQNRVFSGGIDFMLPNGAGAFPMPSTYAVNLFRYNNVVAFATGTVANGKISFSSPAGKTRLDWNFLVADMQGIEGYGSAEVLDTVANKVIAAVPLRFVKEGTPYIVEFGERLAIFQENVVCVVDGSVGGSLAIYEEGVLLVAAATSINLVGSGIVATNVGGAVTITVAGGGGGGSGPTASAVAGTANAITATSNGFTAPSATPQYGWITPLLNSTGAVTIAYDAFGALPLKTPLGAALDADNCLIAGIAYQVRFMTGEIRIQSSGATW